MLFFKNIFSLMFYRIYSKKKEKKKKTFVIS